MHIVDVHNLLITYILLYFCDKLVRFGFAVRSGFCDKLVGC